jgi:hypothetical protein
MRAAVAAIFIVMNTTAFAQQPTLLTPPSAPATPSQPPKATPNQASKQAQTDCRSIEDSAARLACYDRNAGTRAPQPNAKPATTSNAGAGWELKREKDSMTDKISCILSPIGKPYIQINKGEMFIGYGKRGGVGGFRYRIDEKPPTEMQIPTRTEQQVGAVYIGGARFQQVISGSRLRVSTLTVLNSMIEEDISLEGAKPLYRKMMAECDS